MYGLRPINAKLWDEESITTVLEYTDAVETNYVYYKSLQVVNSGSDSVNIRLQYSTDGVTWINMGTGVFAIASGATVWIDKNDIADLDLCAPWTRISAQTASGTATLTLTLAAM